MLHLSAVCETAKVLSLLIPASASTAARAKCRTLVVLVQTPIAVPPPVQSLHFPVIPPLSHCYGTTSAGLPTPPVRASQVCLRQQASCVHYSHSVLYSTPVQLLAHPPSPSGGHYFSASRRRHRVICELCW